MDILVAVFALVLLAVSLYAVEWVIDILLTAFGRE